jgi:hypothetical protein
MWTKWLRGLDSLGDSVSLAERFGVHRLGDAEERLELRLPEDLRSLLNETDGISGAGRGEPVWPVERIAEENLLLRSAGSTPALPDGADDDLLFFGDIGEGKLLAYELDTGGEISESDVFVWQQGVGEAVWIASDLQSLLDDWVRGELSA